ncbi:MAG: TonB-dependent receptor [Parabacteroides sp.]|nr:TonB-dependent receptor [Parabacteroides sp.]
MNLIHGNKRKSLVRLFLVGVLFSCSMFSRAQHQQVSLSGKNITLKSAFKQIEQQTKLFVDYNIQDVNDSRTIKNPPPHANIKEVLEQLLEGTNCTATFSQGHVIISKKTKTSSAQKQVSGVVKDEKGEPLIGVNVVEKETTNGTVTDINGNFSITVPAGHFLEISYIGYNPQKIKITGKSVYDIVLQEDSKMLEEVVVVGYGTQKKINLTGAIESVNGDKLAKQPVAQASQALIGVAPGLTAIQESGQPGEDKATLRIRGMGSISASNDPLILIDGVEGDINTIDGNDIENISVLKDAASAAIYGSRASNGVILVTTKRAKEGSVTVNYKNYLGWQNPTNLPSFLGALDYMKYTGSDQAIIDAYREGMKTDPDRYPDTDWVDLLFSETNFQQYHNLNVNGGSDKARVLASIAFTDQGANIVNYGFKRYNGRFNSDLKLSDKFDINFDLAFSRSEQNASNATLTAVVRDAFRIAPIYPAIHSDGTWGDGFSGGNPISQVRAGGYNKKYHNEFRALLKANYRPIEGVNISVLYAPSYGDIYIKRASKTYNQIMDWDTKTIRKKGDPNSFNQTNERPFNQSFNAVISYTKTIKGHTFSVLGGYELIKYNYEKFSAGRQYYILQDYEVLDAGSAEYDSNSGTATHHALVSYFGRVNYSFKDCYLFEANIRRDASSRFSKGNRVGIFPSFAVGWRLSEESFMKDISWLSNLKLRASWGELGNQEIGSDFPYASSIVLGDANYLIGNQIVNGAAQKILANKNIKWETTATTNIGADAGFFNQRLTLSADYYIRKTKDILLNIPIPVVTGLEAPIQNIGNVENRGWDVTIGWQDKVSDFDYGIKINFSDVKNEVTNLGGNDKIITGNSIIQLGAPINSIYGYETTGIFQSEEEIKGAPGQFGALKPGNLRYKDQLTVDTDGDGVMDAGDGLINADDRVILGDPFPRYTYGIDLNAGYKGFDMAIALQGVGKRDVLLGGDLVYPLFNAGKVQEWHVKECWSPENMNAKFPVLAATSFGSNDVQASSCWLFNASYLRVRNITLGYTLPDRLLSKVFVKNLRVYFSGQNLLTFDNLPQGIDPLVPNDAAGAIYPIAKSYTFGIDLSF